MLKSVVERAKTIKIIQRKNFGGRNNFDRRTNREGTGEEEETEQNVNEKSGEKRGKYESKGGNYQKYRNKTNAKKCWQCGKVEHFRFECPGSKGNTV